MYGLGHDFFHQIMAPLKPLPAAQVALRNTPRFVRARSRLLPGDAIYSFAFLAVQPKCRLLVATCIIACRWSFTRYFWNTCGSLRWIYAYTCQLYIHIFTYMGYSLKLLPNMMAEWVVSGSHFERSVNPNLVVLNPRRVKPMTLKLILVTSSPGTQHY